VTALAQPRLWHTTHSGELDSSSPAPTLVGRQGVYLADGSLCGYELLFRAAGQQGAQADLWDECDQDLATEHVIAAGFHQGVDVTDGRDASVNFTGAYLLAHDSLQCDPRNVIVEIVESTQASESLVERVRSLREEGYRIALDDFMNTQAQLDLLPFANFVKVDLRDLDEFGPSLVDTVRRDGVVLVAERIETLEQLDMTIALGFDQFQGHYFAKAEVLTVAPASS
jgi:c-di-GMP-related signal transduction protein